MEVVVLYRPVGPEELKLIRESGWKKFPPRLFWQPIFYPVMNEEYAIQIARDWNVNASGSGFVTKFHVSKEYIKKFEVQNVGGEIHNELWIPADELEEFNNNITGIIEVTREFYKEDQ
ncbi:MAG: ADP-ribosylation/crystallin J1 [Chitinophagaceae bacterium]